MTRRLGVSMGLVVLLGTLFATGILRTECWRALPTGLRSAYSGALGGSAASLAEPLDRRPTLAAYAYSLEVRARADIWWLKVGVSEETDATPSAVVLLSPENKTYLTKNVPLTLAVNESTSWIGYSLDSRLNVTVGGNTTLLGLSEGVHTIRVYVNGTAGNMGCSEMVSFTVDTLPPHIEILSPEMRQYNTTSVSLSILINEGASWIGYSLDGQANVTIAGNVTLSGLADGLHGVVVYAADMVGNVAVSEVWFTVATPEPFPEIFPLGIAAVIVGVGAALFIYFARLRKKKPEDSLRTPG